MLPKLIVLAFLKAPSAFAVICAGLGALGLWIVEGGGSVVLNTTNVLSLMPTGLGGFCLWLILGWLVKSELCIQVAHRAHELTVIRLHFPLRDSAQQSPP
jgi:hypothetical protein